MPRPPRPRNTCVCGRECRPRARRCDECRSVQPNRHRDRQGNDPNSEIFMSVDGEGFSDVKFDPAIHDPDSEDPSLVMRYRTLSWGKEDGTSASVWGKSVQDMLLWLVDQVGDASDSETRAVPVAFHFKWDASTILKDFDESGMYLIRKVQTRLKTALCGSRHPREGCPMLADLARNPFNPDGELRTGVDYDDDGLMIVNLMHRYDPADIKQVLGSGGDGDVIAFDPSSKLALAFSAGRRFYVEYRPFGDRYEEWKRVDIHDNGASFVGGLEKVIDTWRPELSAEQREIIRWGKANRGKDGFELDLERLARYSEAECVAHARVSRMLLETIREAAHVVMPAKKMFGSGSIAAEVMRHYQVAKHLLQDHGRDWLIAADQLVPAVDGEGVALHKLPHLTYFGGMIETPVVGLVRQPIHVQDINSAYPNVIAKLPCMRGGHGQWVHASWDKLDLLPEHTVGHVEVSWDVSEDGRYTSTPPFMQRGENGCVYQTLMGVRVWTTVPEFRAARERFGDQVIGHRAVVWVPTCECRMPFWWMAEMYAARLELKRKFKERKPNVPGWQVLYNELEDLPEGDRSDRAKELNQTLEALIKDDDEAMSYFRQEQAIKLIINSIYGKLAEHKRGLGKYTNLHYAALITGGTRSKMRRKAWEREDEGSIIVYQHTDSNKSTGSKPRDEGDTLGAWGYDGQSIDTFPIQPGLSISLKSGKGSTRGCTPARFLEAAKEYVVDVDLTTHPTTWPYLEVHQERMISRNLAEHRNKPQLAGSFRPHSLKIKPSKEKRDLEAAFPMPGEPEAWIVPPRMAVDAPATLAHILAGKADRRRQYVDGLTETDKGDDLNR